MRRWLKRIVLFLTLLLVAAAAGVAWIGSKALVSPERRVLQEYHRRILAEPERYGLSPPVAFTGPRGSPGHIYLPTASGIAHKSRALRAELEQRGVPLPPWGETVGTLVLLHGRMGRKEDHLPIAERFCAAGFACIVWDLPAHGENPCPHATFGAHECADLSGVIASAREAHDLPQPVALFGISQGGAIALQAIAQAKPQEYYAVASVAAFAELTPLIEKAAAHLKLSTPQLAGPTAGLVRVGTQLRAGFDPSSIRPAHAARSIRQPVFIGHGARDRYVSPHNAKAIFDAVPHDIKTLRLIEGGSHGDVLAVGGTEFYADLAEFFLGHLPTR